MSNDSGATEYSIAAVSKLTGVSCHALRVWERRYGFPVPCRSASGHRRYARDQVRMIRRLSELSHGGRSIGDLIADFRDGRQAPNQVLDSWWSKGKGGFYPSADGQLVVGPRGVMNRSSHLAEVNVSEDTELIPALEPGFVVALLAVHRHPDGDIRGPKKAVVFGENLRQLFTLRGPETLAENSLPWDKRVFYYPRSGLLVTVENNADRLILRRADLAEELDRAGTDCLLVLSRPPAAVAGGRFEYAIDARSAKGGLKYALDAGPAGMVVGEDGKVTWDVPDDFASPVRVVVNVSDAGGREALHAFELAPPAGK